MLTECSKNSVACLEGKIREARTYLFPYTLNIIVLAELSVIPAYYAVEAFSKKNFTTLSIYASCAALLVATAGLFAAKVINYGISLYHNSGTKNTCPL